MGSLKGLPSKLVTVLYDVIKRILTKISEVVLHGIAAFWKGEAELRMIFIHGYMKLAT